MAAVTPTPAALVSSAEDFLKSNYDFVIVGGGTAGLTLASRLTEDPNVSVGVLEAGECKLGDVLVDTPAMFTQMFGKEDYEWNFMTTPQEHNEGKVHHMVRGKMLGGSSGINYMMYVRGSDNDYDDWATLVGNDRWGSKSIKSYMRKQQTLEPVPAESASKHNMPIDLQYHGTDGPVRTSFNDSALPIEGAVIAAADETTGYADKPIDPWSGDHIGFFHTMGSVSRTGDSKGKRSYAARGYFAALAGERPNLKVLCNATVSKVLLDSNKAVTGVRFNHGGATHEVKTKREVLVCGGAVQSPQILEISGIGDPDILKAAGVDCILPLPGVGANFQDHVLNGVGYDLKPGVLSADVLKDPKALQVAVNQLQTEAGGPLTNISSVQGFFPYSRIASPEEVKETVASVRNTKPESEFHKKQLEQIAKHLESDHSANLQLVLIPVSADFDGGIKDQSKLFMKMPSGPDAPHGISLAVLVSYPASRGTVHITSPDPATSPRIDPGYISHPADVAVLSASLRWLDDKLVKSQHLQPLIGARHFPDQSRFKDLSDTATATAASKDWCMGTYHPIGSCAAGVVVDSEFKVKGAQGLRVVDASVFPSHVSGNICSSVYAVAEMAADVIKDKA